MRHKALSYLDDPPGGIVCTGRPRLRVLCAAVLLQLGCVTTHHPLHAPSPTVLAKNAFYSSIPTTSFTLMASQYGESRQTLMPFKREMKRLFLHDIANPDVPRESKMKALFGLTGIWDAGSKECLGAIIPTLIRMSQNDDPYLNLFVYDALMRVIPSTVLLRQTSWRSWWLREGQWLYTDTCEHLST